LVPAVSIEQLRDENFNLKRAWDRAGLSARGQES
jgi:hypothetical protein